MTNYDLIVFYNKAGRCELDHIKRANDPETDLHMIDLRHLDFCWMARNGIMLNIMWGRMKTGTIGEKIVTGFRLYEWDVLLLKHRDDWN